MSKDVSVERGVNSAICTLVHCASTRVELEHVCDFVTRGRGGCGIHCDIAVILGPRGQTEKGGGLFWVPGWKVDIDIFC
eukprot:scaffold23460_cov69-Phaeocystis_antarctica.AAC.8